MEKKKIIKFISYILVSILVGVTVVYAGSLTPPENVTRTMYSLNDIYNLTKGDEATPPSGAIDTPPELSSSLKTLTQIYNDIYAEIEKLHDNIKSGETIFGVSGKASVVDTEDATAESSDILSSKTGYVNGVKITGNIENQTLSNTNDTVTGGYYTSTTLSSIDTDLIAENIKSGITIFGVTGSLSAGTNYSLPKTGQTTSYQPGDDGIYQKGFTGTRFVDNGNNTIKDNATGLMWKKCSEGQSGTDCAATNATGFSWVNAITACENYTIGIYDDWRLPNVMELYSILNFQSSGTAIDLAIFPATKTNVEYWSSTTSKGTTTSTMGVSFANGKVSLIDKSTSTFITRCVR